MDIAIESELLAEALAHALCRRDGSMKRLAFFIAKVIMRDHVDLVTDAIKLAMTSVAMNAAQDAVKAEAVRLANSYMSSYNSETRRRLDAIASEEFVRRFKDMSNMEILQIMQAGKK